MSTVSRPTGITARLRDDELEDLLEDDDESASLHPPICAVSHGLSGSRGVAICRWLRWLLPYFERRAEATGPSHAHPAKT